MCPSKSMSKFDPGGRYMQKTMQKNDAKTMQKRYKNDAKTMQKRCKNDAKTIQKRCKKTTEKRCTNESVVAIVFGSL